MKAELEDEHWGEFSYTPTSLASLFAERGIEEAQTVANPLALKV